jgi:uncharacterized protein (TIGR04255 family)
LDGLFKQTGDELSEQEFPKLTRPPLREALIDIQLRQELPATVLSKFQPPKGFPVTRPLIQSQFQLKVEADKPMKPEVISEGMLGQRYEREDSSEIIQFRRNGMTYSILKNYPGWKVFSDAAKEMWQGFLSTTGSVNVGRLAVRYINAINIPPGSDYDEYLTTGPRVPKSVHPVVASFMQRVVIPFEKETSTAIFTQALEAPNTAVAVLDIDVFTECSIDGASPDIWSRLLSLRGIADKIFFASLTEKVLDSYR